MKIDSEKVLEGVRELFRIKRFVNIEFTAKQAFENLNLAMVFLQIALFIFVVCALIGGYYFIRRKVFKYRIRRITDLLQRLVQEDLLLSSKVDASKEVVQARKQTRAQLRMILASNGSKNLLGKQRHALLKIVIDQLEGERLSKHHLEMLYNAITWLSSL